MNFNGLILKNVKYNIRNYLSYIIGTSIVLSILFMFFNFFYSPIFIEKSKEIFKDAEKNVLMAIIVIFLIAFISYITVIFMKSRGKELGIYYTIGLTSKEILRILFCENIIILSISIALGLSTGILFSKLFNMLFLKVMKMDNLQVGINSMGFIASLVCIISILLINCMYQRIVLKRNSIVDLIKFSVKKEKVGKGALLKGILAIIFFVISLKKVNDIINDPAAADYKELLFIIVGIVSLYYLIGTFMVVVDFILRGLKKIYNTNIITIKTLSSRFLTYRITIFSVMIMTCLGMFFTVQGVVYYKMAGNWIDSEYKSDISIIVNKEQLEKENFKDLIKKSGGEIKEYNELENIRETYFKYDANNEGYNICPLRIISNETYNKNTNLNVKLEENEAIVSETDVEKGKITIDKDIILKVDDDGEAIDKKTVVDYAKDIDKYKEKNKESTYLKYDKNNIKYENMKLSNMIYDYSISDMRPGFFVVNDQVYNKIKNTLSPKNIYYDILVDLKSDNNYIKLEDNLKEYLNSIGGNELAETLNVKSYLRYKERVKGGFIFFTFFFLGMIAFLGSGGVLYFKIFTSLDEDRERKKKFVGIGLTSYEIKKIITKEIRIIFLSPVVVAAIIVIFLLMKIYNLTQDGYIGKNIMLYISIGYSMAYLIIYKISKKEYLRKVFSLN